MTLFSSYHTFYHNYTSKHIVNRTASHRDLSGSWLANPLGLTWPNLGHQFQSRIVIGQSPMPPGHWPVLRDWIDVIPAVSPCTGPSLAGVVCYLVIGYRFLFYLVNHIRLYKPLCFCHFREYNKLRTVQQYTPKIRVKTFYLQFTHHLTYRYFDIDWNPEILGKVLTVVRVF